MSVGAPDWSGTRLLHGTQQLFNMEDDNIAPGGSVTHSVQITRPGYILELHAWNNTDNTTALPFSVLMRWQDGVSGDGLDSQLWYAFAGTAVAPHYIDGAGPTKGGILEIVITNNAAATAHLSTFLIIDETTFAYERHDWRSDDIFGINFPGWNLAGFDYIADLSSAGVAHSVAAGATVSYLLALYSGPVQVYADSAAIAGKFKVTITTASETGAGTGILVFSMISGAALNLGGLVYLPRAQCAINITNLGTSAHNCDWSVVMAER